jgi:hypothetical protein
MKKKIYIWDLIQIITRHKAETKVKVKVKVKEEEEYGLLKKIEDELLKEEDGLVKEEDGLK